MPVFTDQLKRSVSLTSLPKRIVSLVPSQTELLFNLGLDEEVIGITKFCVHPDEWFREKTRVGGTKNVHLEAVAALQPDLIIANKEENVKEQVESLATRFPVWISDINNLEDALQMICSVGAMTGKAEAAESLAFEIRNRFAQLKITGPKRRAAYLIWKDPCMTVGGDTFIHHMLEAAGFENIFKDRSRYPAITVDELQNTGCEVLLLSSEPYPFRTRHIDEWQQQLPGTKICLVDGEMFSWYGSRLVHAPAYFSDLQSKMGLLT